LQIQYTYGNGMPDFAKYAYHFHSNRKRSIIIMIFEQQIAASSFIIIIEYY